VNRLGVKWFERASLSRHHETVKPSLRLQGTRLAFSVEHWNEIDPLVVVVVGIVLVVVPEPATSSFGAGSVFLGIAWWFHEWGR
jgi:hypothetical protein